MKSSHFLFSFILISLVFACQPAADTEANTTNQESSSQVEETAGSYFTSPLGKQLAYPEPSEKALSQYETAKQEFETNPNDVEKIIWYGRRAAYLGRYEEAIQIYIDGIDKHPEDARLFRHRGHRYISTREFDRAIMDFQIAAKLIRGKENEIEPDGLPNAQNIPISTLHGNIWYHLGLVYYLTQDYENALKAYQNCRAVGNNDDNIVSSTHWLYMIQRRLGNLEAAKKVLEPIHADMNIIENHSYYDLCKFYKGMVPIESIQGSAGSPSSDAVKYGLANWHFYNGDMEKAKMVLEELLESKSWSSFGYIAAESDMLAYFQN